MAANKRVLQVTSKTLSILIRKWAGKLDPRILRDKTRSGAIHAVNPSFKPLGGIRPALYRKYHHGRKVTNEQKNHRSK